MRPVSFDIDVLRSFVYGVQSGSFALAADKLARSTSAISAQMKKLEAQVGEPLLRKAGRGLALTEAGEQMFAYAQRLVSLNDEAVFAVSQASLQGWVSLGLQEDLSGFLPSVLGQFARAHPKVRVQARIARSQTGLNVGHTVRDDLCAGFGHERLGSFGDGHVLSPVNTELSMSLQRQGCAVRVFKSGSCPGDST